MGVSDCAVSKVGVRNMKSGENGALTPTLFVMKARR